MESTLEKPTQSTSEIAQLNEFWRDMMDTLDSQICILDPEGQIVEANGKWQAYVDLLGLHEASGHKKSFLDYCRNSPAYGGPAGSQEVASAVMAILTGKQTTFEQEYLSVFSGEERQLSVQLKAMPTGSLGAIVVIQKDRTELREHERRLHEARSQAETLANALETSQQSLEFAMRGANLGLWHWDLNSGYFELTKDWLNALGYDQLDLNADIKSFRVLLHPEDLVLWTEDDALSIAGDEPYDRQFRLRRKDGSYAWAQSLGRANSFRSNGSPESLSGVLIDIDARKTAELRDAGMAKIIEESVNEVYVFDRETLYYIEVNRGARENLGYSLEEMRKMIPCDVNPNCEEETLREKIKPLWMGEIARLDFETTYQRKDGTIYPVMVNVQASQLMGRSVLVVSAVDLTQRKELEMQLSQAQKLESIGQLSAGIAHEMNTPMQYIGNNIKFLSDCSENLVEVIDAYEQHLGIDSSDGELLGDLPLELAEVLKRTRFGHIRKELPCAISESLHGVDRVLKIIRAMKEFSHPGGKGKEPTDLNRAISSTAIITQNQWKEVADLELNLAPDLALVVCDPGSLNQVFVNLIVNAVDAIVEKNKSASVKKKGFISVRTRLDGEEALIEFTDSGCGMTEEVRGRIFDPFYTTKEVGQGTGQGLSLSHTIITQKHEGSILVDSQPGKGTTFTIRIPIDSVATSSFSDDSNVATKE